MPIKSSNAAVSALQNQFLNILIITIFIATSTSLIAFESLMSSEASNGDHGALHHAHNHHIAVFTGLTSNLKANHTALSLGIDYVFRLPLWHHRISVGLFGEIIIGDHAETIIGTPIFLQHNDIKMMCAPAIAFSKDDHGHSHKHFVSRLGIGYDLHFLGYSITPILNTDFIDGHISLVYGISFGTGF